VTTLERSRAYPVTTQAQYVAGAEDLKRVKAAQKKLEDTRTGITGPMNAALKKVNDFFRAPKAALGVIEQKIKGARAYAEEQERVRRAEQAKADEAARKERERIEAQARAPPSPARSRRPPRWKSAPRRWSRRHQREPPKVAGVSMREVWKFEVTDPSAVPREFCTVDETKIRKVVQALKGDAKIAGVRVYVGQADRVERRVMNPTNAPPSTREGAEAGRGACQPPAGRGLRT
jgi:hypothetical protein